MEKLSAKNRKFWALGKRAKRVAIAKDIISQISKGKIKPKKGSYGILPEAPEENGKLDEFLAGQKRPCKACALGSCMISLVNLGDRVEISDVVQKSWIGDVFCDQLDDDKMRTYLTEIFRPNQLVLIESAFEKRSFAGDDNQEGCTLDHDNDQVIEAISFGRVHGDPTDRLIAICKNIVKNEGTFKP